MNIKENLEVVRREIEDARSRSITGEEVELIAVSKNHGIDKIKEAYDCGVRQFGENRVQELKEKISLLNDEFSFHMIGNLQANKVKYIYDKVNLIQSLDRESILKEIQKRAEKDSIITDCLIQVNIGREPQKGGVDPDEVLEFLEKTLECKNIRIRGLMAIAPDTDDEKYLRSCFREMFKIKEDISNRNYEEVSMEYLSMGMSNDFKIAIEEGANMVRIGSRIFGKREY